jgi:hypothetical protein
MSMPTLTTQPVVRENYERENYLNKHYGAGS